jgi:hypothetical protein
MKIPQDIYDSVFDLATKLASSRESGDTKAFWAHYNELSQYCEAQRAAGGDHPFLWETLADFTDDDRAAIDLYKSALAEAREPDAGAYRASIQLALAERYRAMGNADLAYKYASEANEEAKASGDLELRRTISEFLLEKARRI